MSCEHPAQRERARARRRGGHRGRATARPSPCSVPTARASRRCWASLPGLVRPATGRVVLDGEALTDVGPGRPGTMVAPHARRTALLGQDALLFPHLDALENVAFGPRSSGTSRSTARADAQRWLDEVGVGDLAAPAAATALRRPGPAGGGRPRPGGGPSGAPARRADGGARRGRAAGAASGAAAGARRPHGDRGHPRPARRAAARRPGGRAGVGPGGRAGSEPRRACAPAQRLRRPAGGAEPGAWHVARRRRARRRPGGPRPRRGRHAAPTASRPSQRSGRRPWPSTARRCTAARATPSPSP